MNSYNETACAPAAESEIRSATQRVGTAIHGIDRALTDLVEQLGYVLKDNEACPPRDCTARLVPGYSSPLARDLLGCIGAIDALTDHVIATKARLAL